MARDRWVTVGLWLLAVLWMTWSASYTWESAVDDAYITARYASQIAAGNGVVFNAHEPPIEGVTNLAWTFWLALGLKLGFSVLDWMLVWGWVCSVAALGLVVLITRALAADAAKSGPLHALPALLLASLPHFAVITTNGLETAQWVATVLAVVWGWTALEGGRRWWAGLFGALLVWVRPEGLAVVLWLSALDAALPPRGPRWAFAAPALGSELLLLAWRWTTYGRWVPNTWDAKANFPITETFTQNAGYFTPERWVLGGLLAAFVLAAILLRVGPRPWFVRLDWRPWLGFVGTTLLLAAIPLTVNEWMPGLRLFQPSMALTLCALGVLACRFSRPPLLAAMALIFAVSLAWESTDRVRDYDGRHSVGRRNGAATAAYHLQQHVPDGAWLATRDAGVLAYFVGPGIKVAELHQRALTQLHPSGKDAVVTSYTPRNPEIFISTVRTADQPDFEYPNDRKVWERMNEPYVYLGRVNQHYRRHYDVYVRADLGVPPLPADVVVSMAGPKPGAPGAPPAVRSANDP